MNHSDKLILEPCADRRSVDRQTKLGRFTQIKPNFGKPIQIDIYNLSASETYEV